ncbi:hypothetical protein BHE90_006439 [Fusarium euwallaceae]|uniref:Uncharacterized protein n=2 Tax=Fusarium solani species complex TaxID=232080 RepID=A0A3M2SF32_9HYPO|nr:hypothetical protein CDV36_004098 [Fusarium kuroshium]RTE79086.1 hypothetical protein BHE90_006439 [Fusarium euwallaceae]
MPSRRKAHLDSTLCWPFSDWSGYFHCYGQDQNSARLSRTTLPYVTILNQALVRPPPTREGHQDLPDNPANQILPL